MKRLRHENMNTPAFYDARWRAKVTARPYYDYVRLDALVEKAADGMKVIDLGAGVYGAAQYLAEKSPLILDITAMDFSARARELTPQLPGLKYYLGDVLDNGFPAGSFDLVIAGELIEHMEAPEALVAEMARLAISGGWLSCSTLDMSSEAAQAHGDYPEHIFSFTGDDLIALFSPVGRAEHRQVGNYHIVHCQTF